MQILYIKHSKVSQNLIYSKSFYFQNYFGVCTRSLALYAIHADCMCFVQRASVHVISPDLESSLLEKTGDGPDKDVCM